MSEHLQAEEAERACLGALLLDPAAIAQVGTLTAADFHQPPHATIFRAIREALDAGTGRVDQLVVMEVLRSHGDLLRIGGATYLHTLESSAPTVGNIGYYARLVSAASTRRTLLAYAVKLRQICDAPDFDNVLDNAAELAVAIGATADGITTDTGADPLTDLYEMGAFVNTPSPAHDWVIPGLLERMDRVVVVASEGAGKSTWARMVAVMLGQGIHPLNPDLRIPPKRTLIVDLENPPALVRRKSRGLVNTTEAYGGGWNSENVWLWSRPGGVNLRKPADCALLDRVVGHVRPALISLGPLYKAAIEGGDRGEQVASETAAALDRIRERHHCALWLEHHAPMEQNGTRNLRPVGSGVWSRWPEFGISLSRDRDYGPHSYRLDRFRGDRDERCWPDHLSWGQQWPFEPSWQQGMPRELFDGRWNEGAA